MTSQSTQFISEVNDRAFIYSADTRTYDEASSPDESATQNTTSRRHRMHVKDLFQLEGKVALITGGSRGLGLQMAEALGEMGCRVAITARKADELAEAKMHLQARGIEVHTVVNDLAKFDRIPDLVSEILAQHNHIDILVNNAGATWGAPAEDYPDEAWHKVMNLNINAPFFLAREVGKRSMIPRRAGKIINVASIAGLKGAPAGMTTIAYNTSKAAAINFTRALASEWGRHNINVNAICPGFFPSKMSAGLLASMEEQVIAHSPLHRLGGDEDLKGSVVFLASEASRHITGQYLAVDGGASIV
jgi:NAD(P)-dependent dehydrogenase (short-subunit alcohol dehydrogenase family)